MVVSYVPVPSDTPEEVVLSRGFVIPRGFSQGVAHIFTNGKPYKIIDRSKWMTVSVIDNTGEKFEVGYLYGWETLWSLPIFLFSCDEGVIE